MYIRGDRMNTFRLAVDADMGPHPEIPLVALLRLVHLRIPLLRAILRRTGGTDDRGIHDRPTADLQTVRGQMFSDSGKELFPDLLGFQQMPKLADRCFIRHRLATQINAHKLSQGP